MNALQFVAHQKRAMDGIALELEDAVILAHRAGATRHDIALVLGVSPRTITRWLRRISQVRHSESAELDGQTSFDEATP